MFYDAHTHLNANGLFEDRSSYYDGFVANEGKGIVTVGMDPEHNWRAIQLAQATQDNAVPIKITLGIHPYEIGHGSIQSKQDVDNQIIIIKQQLKEYGQYVIAIGECGLDAHYEGRDKNQALQTYAFTQQCILAQEVGLPLVIHSRDAFDASYDIIKQYSDLDVYFHCRGYGAYEIQKLHKALPSLWIGFCGNLTYKKAENLRDSLAAARVFRDEGVHVLFETDAPYLTPQTKRGTQNEPLFVQYIYEFAAKHLCIKLDEMQQTIATNRHALYSD